MELNLNKSFVDLQNVLQKLFISKLGNFYFKSLKFSLFSLSVMNLFIESVRANINIWYCFRYFTFKKLGVPLSYCVTRLVICFIKKEYSLDHIFLFFALINETLLHN